MRKDVAAILFDEPLTVIDPHMKWILRRQLKKIHQQLKLTLIYVTHDQVEALTFADEVVVMTNGRVVQKGGPEALFLRPDHAFVGYFIGSPGMNLLSDRARCRWRRRSARSACRSTAPRSPRSSARAATLTLGIRPEFTRRSPGEAPGAVQGEVVARAEPRQLPARHRAIATATCSRPRSSRT